MELSKKTTILLSPRLYSLLKDLSLTRKQSMGDLIRSACEKQYGLFPESDAVAAVESLARLRLPVGSPSEIKAESVPEPESLMP